MEPREANEVPGDPSSKAGLAGWIRENPYTSGLVAAFTAAGVAGALWLPIGDFSLAQRIFGGAIAGFYFGLFPIGYRMFD